MSRPSIPAIFLGELITLIESCEVGDVTVYHCLLLRSSVFASKPLGGGRMLGDALELGGSKQRGGGKKKKAAAKFCPTQRKKNNKKKDNPNKLNSTAARPRVTPHDLQPGHQNNLPSHPVPPLLAPPAQLSSSLTH